MLRWFEQASPNLRRSHSQIRYLVGAQQCCAPFGDNRCVLAHSVFVSWLCSVFYPHLALPGPAQKPPPDPPRAPKNSRHHSLHQISIALNINNKLATAMTMLKTRPHRFRIGAITKSKLSASRPQPFPEYTKGLTTEQALAFFSRITTALAEQQKFAASIGPAMLNAEDPESQADLLVEVLKNTKSINAKPCGRR